MKMLLAVAAGGAVGAIGRYWLSAQVYRLVDGTFPWGTLAVNVLGCAILGVFVELMALVWSPSEEIRAFLTVGMLGALTTFSAFSLELVLMIERSEWVPVALYIVLSVALSVGAMVLAMKGMRLILT